MSRTKQNPSAAAFVTVRPEAGWKPVGSGAVRLLTLREQLVEQRRFTVRLGHETHESDSAARWEKLGVRM